MKVFTINKHGDHLGHVTCTIYVSFLSYFPRRFHSTYNFALIDQAVSEQKMFDNNSYIHVYNPGTGVDNPLGSISFHLQYYSVSIVFAASFPPLNDFISFTHSKVQVT